MLRKSSIAAAVKQWLNTFLTLIIQTNKHCSSVPYCFFKLEFIPRNISWPTRLCRTAEFNCSNGFVLRTLGRHGPGGHERGCNDRRRHRDRRYVKASPGKSIFFGNETFQLTKEWNLLDGDVVTLGQTDNNKPIITESFRLLAVILTNSVCNINDININIITLSVL